MFKYCHLIVLITNGYDVLDVRQLRYFVTLAEHRHFGRAAAILHIAQPALTRQIKLLEEELGVSLFERHARGASPTESAAVLLRHAVFVLRLFEQMRSDVIATRDDVRGPVAIGMSPALAVVTSGTLVGHVRADYPNVLPRIEEDATGTLQQKLLAGELDLAVLNGPASDVPHLITSPLMREQVCLIGPPDILAESPVPLRIEMLAGIPLVLAGLPHVGIRKILSDAATERGMPLDAVAEANSVQVALQIALRIRACTVHFVSPLQEALRTRTVNAVPIEGLYLRRFLARAADRPPSRATQIMWDAMKTTVATMIETGGWPHASLL